MYDSKISVKCDSMMFSIPKYFLKGLLCINILALRKTKILYAI